MKMKRLFHCLTILTLGLLLSGILSTGALAQEEASPAEEEISPAEQAFTEGQEAFYKGLYDEAITLLAEAASLAPEDASYAVALGKAYYAAGRVDEAESQFEEILDDHPTNVEAGKELAAIYAQREEWQEVLDVLTDLLPYKHDYVMFKLLADAAYELAETSQAKEYYREALRFNDEAPLDHYRLGDIYLTESKFRLAANEYSRALELDYDDALIHYKLGTAYFNLGNYLGQVGVREIPDGTVEQISEELFLIEAAPWGADTFHCAPVHSAIYQVKKAMDMGIESPEASLLFANIYFHTNRFERAIGLFLQIEAEIADEDKELFYTYLGQAYFRTGRYEEHLDAIKEATAADPEAQRQALEGAYYSIAERSKQLGDTESQIAYLLKCIESAPTNAQYHLDLGDAYYRLEDYENAATQWRMTLDLQPDHPEQMRLINLLNELEREKGG